MRWIIALAVAGVASILALGAIGVPASTYRSGDFMQFWVQPHALLEGANPYDSGWWTAFHARTGDVPLFPEAVYPPWDAILFLPIGLLPLPIAAATWLVVQVATVGAVLLLVARRMLDPRMRPLLLGAAAGFQPLWLLVVGGNMTGFLFGLVGGSFLAIVAGRPLLAGSLLGLLVMKPHPVALLVVVVVLAAQRRERRSIVLGGILTAGCLMGVMALLRPGWLTAWAPAALALQSAPGSNATAWTLGRAIGGGPVLSVAAVGLIVVALGAWMRWRRPPLPLAFSAATAISVAIAPHGWSYDQLLLLVPLAMSLTYLQDLPAPRRSLLAGVTVLVSTVVPWALYALAFRRGGEELSVLTPLLAFAALVLFDALALRARRPEQAGAAPATAAT